MVFLIEASSTRAVVVGNPHRGVGDGNLHRLHPIERANRFLDAHLAVISSGSGGLKENLAHEMRVLGKETRWVEHKRIGPWTVLHLI